jgi:hypothetical protein
MARGRSQRQAICLLSATTLIYNLGTYQIWDKAPKISLISNHISEIFQVECLFSVVGLENKKFVAAKGGGR